MGKLIDSTQYENDQAKRVTDLEKELGEVRDTETQVPDKFKGKSLDDVIHMYQEAEKEKSRLGNEVGQLRQQVLQRPVQPEIPKKKDVDVDALLENPEQAVETIVNQSETVKRLNEQVNTIDRDRQRREFESKHSDWTEDVKNDEFIDWIKANPVRHQLGVGADSGDFRAANLLWDMWAEVKDIKKQATDNKKAEIKQKRDKQLQDGTLESGTGSTTESKKVFRRSEIRDIKTRAKLGDRQAQNTVNDPQWQQEVMAAYAQGRVV